MIQLQKKQKAALIVAGVVTAFILLEFSLRAISFFYSRQKMYNMDGLHMQKQTGVYNIICLGDSWTYGTGAGEGDGYPEQLQDILNKRVTKQTFKVYNLGFPNFNSAMVLQKFKDSYLFFNPDMVIVMMGKSDQWNVKGMDSKQMRLGGRIKLFFLQSKIGELAAILKFNLEYKWNHAKKIEQDTISLHPQDNPEDMIDKAVEKGNEYRAKGMLKKACSYYKYVLNIKPNHDFAALELSRCYKLAQEYDSAAFSLLKALKADADNETIYAELDDIFIRQNEPRKRVYFYTQLLSEYADNSLIRTKLVNAFIALGNTLFKQQRFEEAIEAYNKSIALDPNNPKIRNLPNYNIAIVHNYANRTKITGFNATQDQKSGLSIKEKRENNLFNNLKELIEICEKENIKLVFSSYPKDLLEPMQEAASFYDILLIDQRPTFNILLQQASISRYFVKNGHCNKAGYRAVAENIARAIIEIVAKGLSKS